MDRNFKPNKSRIRNRKSLSARRAWIEIIAHTARNTSIASLSARRAWIEIRRFLASWSAVLVALRKESVDRNSLWAWTGGLSYEVALRKESVDRNVG